MWTSGPDSMYKYVEADLVGGWGGWTVPVLWKGEKGW